MVLTLVFWITCLKISQTPYRLFPIHFFNTNSKPTYVIQSSQINFSHCFAITCPTWLVRWEVMFWLYVCIYMFVARLQQNSITRFKTSVIVDYWSLSYWWVSLHYERKWIITQWCRVQLNIWNTATATGLHLQFQPSNVSVICDTFYSALTLLVEWYEGHLACKKLSVGLLVIWLQLCVSYSSSCHHRQKKSRMKTFWYRLTQVHLEMAIKTERVSYFL